MSDGTNTAYYELERKVIDRIKNGDKEMLKLLASYVEYTMAPDEVRRLAASLGISETA